MQHRRRWKEGKEKEELKAVCESVTDFRPLLESREWDRIGEQANEKTAWNRLDQERDGISA